MRRICIVLALLVACGGDDGPSTVPDDAPGADAPMADGPPSPDAPVMALSRTLVLAFGGGMVTPGVDDATANTSTLVKTAATLPPYLDGDPLRNSKTAAILGQLVTIFAPYNVNVVLTRPATEPYHLMLFTSAMPSAVGITGGGSAFIPATCNTTPSVIGFVFGSGAELPRDVAVRNAIAMFGLASGIPLSTKTGDCMCLAGTSCANLPAPCTIGGAGTPIATGPGSCDQTGTMDEAALFLAKFGMR